MLAVLIGAGVGFVVGMLIGGRVAGGKIVRHPVGTESGRWVPAIEGDTPGFRGVLLQLFIALIGTVIGAALGFLVAAA